MFIAMNCIFKVLFQLCIKFINNYYDEFSVTLIIFYVLVIGFIQFDCVSLAETRFHEIVAEIYKNRFKLKISKYIFLRSIGNPQNGIEFNIH